MPKVHKCTCSKSKIRPLLVFVLCKYDRIVNMFCRSNTKVLEDNVEKDVHHTFPFSNLKWFDNKNKTKNLCDCLLCCRLPVLKDVMNRWKQIINHPPDNERERPRRLAAVNKCCFRFVVRRLYLCNDSKTVIMLSRCAKNTYSLMAIVILSK